MTKQITFRKHRNARATAIPTDTRDYEKDEKAKSVVLNDNAVEKLENLYKITISHKLKSSSSC